MPVDSSHRAASDEAPQPVSTASDPSQMNAAACVPGTAIETPRVGEIWQSIYAIVEASSDAATARYWRATDRESGETVIIRELPAFKANPREDAWRTLQSISHPNLLPARTSFHLEKHRFEVTAAPSGCSLSAWRKQNVPDGAFIERLVGTLTEVLKKLHARGVVHFGVRLENIYLRETATGTTLVLGGAEHATPFNQSGLIPMPVDPLVAPPEAAGLFQHSPGTGLCTWDWWMVGRVVQELILGQSVLALVMKRDGVIRCPEVLSRAEALLLERDTSGVRAGAVELMPSLEPRVERLLYGLLTSCADARWDAPAVAQWIAGQPVEHQYALPRGERLFRIGDRAYTLPQTAEKLRMETDWSVVVNHVWDVQRPGTLAHFVAESPQHRALHTRLMEVRGMSSNFGFKSVAPETVREVLAAVALLEMAGQTLVWRGRRLAEETIEKVFSELPSGQDWLGFLQAFTVRPVLFLIERWDAAAAKQLSEYSHIVTNAETVARQHCWLRDNDAAGRSQLWREALRPLAQLRDAAAALHENFACSTLPKVDLLFKLSAPTRSQLVTLVWLGQQSARHGFLTHAQWAEREHARLRLAAQEQVAILNWLRLARALGAGPTWFAGWIALATTCLGFSLAIMALWPGPRWLPLALVPWAVALVGRMVTNFWIRAVLRRVAPQVAAWRFDDGGSRCDTELTALGVIGKPTGTQRELDRLVGEIKTLSAKYPAPTSVTPPERFLGAWIGAGASWLTLVVFVGAGVWQARYHRPSYQEFVRAWRPAPAVSETKQGTQTATEKSASAMARETEEANLPTKVSWPFKPGDEAQKLTVKDSVEARGDQIRYLNERTRKFLERYKPETISTLILMRVPTKTGFGVMLFDGKLRQIVNPRVYLLEYAPFPRSWVEVAGRSAIFIPD